MNNQEKLHKIFWLYIVADVIIFSIGILLRSVEIINGNYLFGFDHGRDYLAAYSIVEKHKPTLIGAEVGAGSAGLNGIFHGPGYFYLISLMYVLFNGDPYGGLVLMFIFGVATLAVCYIYFSKISNRISGMIMLFLVSISPLIAPQSRFIWNHHLSSFFIVLVLFFTYSIPINPLIYAPLAIFTAGFIYHFELAIAVPMVLAILTAIVFVYKINNIKVYLFSLGSLVLSVFPMILFEIRHGFMATSSILKYLFLGSKQISFGTNTFKDHILSYAFNAKDSFIIEGGFFSWEVYLYLCLFLFIGIIIYARKSKNDQEKKFIYTTIVILLISYLVFLLLRNTVWDYYLIHAHFIFMYFFAVLSALFFH